MQNQSVAANWTRPLRSVPLLLILLVSLALQACGSQQADPVDGEGAPAFTLPNAIGEEVSLSDYTGEKPVLLYFHMAVG